MAGLVFSAGYVLDASICESHDLWPPAIQQYLPDFKASRGVLDVNKDGELQTQDQKLVLP